MTIFPKLPDRKDSPSFSAPLLCLLIIGALEFLLMIKSKSVYGALSPLTPMGIYGSLAVFWAVSLWRCPRCVLRRDVWLGILTAAWFLFLQLLRRYIHTSGQNIPLFLSVYLIALPFAAATEDSRRQAGIRAVAMIYLAASAYLAAMAVILFVGGDSPALAERLILWKAGRMYLVHHPNTVARIFMVAICLSLGFLEHTKKPFVRGLLLLFTAVLFLGQSLTNSRACTLITCLLLGGNLFFRFRRSSRKSLIFTLAAAAAAAAVIFLVYNGLFRWNIDRLLNPPGTEALKDATTMPGFQGSWSADLPTLNGRTLIWAGALKKVVNDPWILLRGGEYGKIPLEHFVANHSHNAWLETLLRLGLPGLLLSLIFTWRAFRSSLYILLHPKAGLWEKNIAMLSFAMMATSMVEPFLFITTASAHFFDFIFFLSLGYLTLWSRELKEPC